MTRDILRRWFVEVVAARQLKMAHMDVHPYGCYPTQAILKDPISAEAIQYSLGIREGRSSPYIA